MDKICEIYLFGCKEDPSKVTKISNVQFKVIPWWLLINLQSTFKYFSLAYNATFLIFIWHILVFHFYFLFIIFL